MSFVQNEQFFDLYIGAAFCDVSRLRGSVGISPAPDAWNADIQDIRSRCLKLRESTGDDEFQLVYDSRAFRVTTHVDVDDEIVFALAITDQLDRSFDSLGYPRPLQDALMDPGLSGLVLFGGPMGAGKTTSAATLARARMEQLGEFFYAVEDPRETNLNGRFGRGRGLQVPAGRDGRGLEEQLVRGIRSRADAFYIGEVRRAREAYQVAQCGVNGHLILATSHGNSLPDLIERLAALASEYHRSSTSLLASGLAIVVYQELDVVPVGKSVSSFLRADFLVVQGDDSVRAKIRSGRFADLVQDTELQRNKLLWSNDTPRV
ncbi:ATPase, T2SS/T4P/T4SS family [Burkholderia vietnamiensis]|uniref:ATPase, T2SS/T4P/T4SS family n=1 Tax=Burkholderia vietnamiensis TaxID=60552 RepID=UPI0015937CCC|nr:ATPase, T2SS/T4P/T4SS family [Burkholderia vietnamiensis]MCA8270708.1 GspE family protein [Burkholderia vietnamiensis]